MDLVQWLMLQVVPVLVSDPLDVDVSLRAFYSDIVLGSVPITLSVLPVIF